MRSDSGSGSEAPTSPPKRITFAVSVSQMNKAMDIGLGQQIKVQINKDFRGQAATP